jgi:hypothetical protein
MYSFLADDCHSSHRGQKRKVESFSSLVLKLYPHILIGRKNTRITRSAAAHVDAQESNTAKA